MKTRTIMQPKEPKIGLKDDPLLFLIEMTCTRQLKTYKHFKIYLLLTHCWFTYIASIGVYKLVINYHDNKFYVIHITFLVQGILWTLIAWFSKDLVLYYQIFVQKNFWSLRSAGDELFEQMENECKSFIKFTAYINFVLTIAAVLTGGVYKGDEGHWQITVNIIRTWPNWIKIPMMIMIDSVCFIWGFNLSVPSAVFLYVVNHIKFQYILLNSYFEFLIETKGDIEDENYQKLVNSLLRQCVIIHTNILRSTNIVKKWFPLFTIILIVTLLCSFVAGGYFILAEISRKDNFRIYIVLMGCLSEELVFCIYCQFAENKSMEIITNAYNCPWVNWNNRNRKFLIIIFMNSMKPMQTSKYGLPSVNFALIIKLIKNGYAILMFIINTNK